MSEKFYTPPPFRVCPDCRGKKYVIVGTEEPDSVICLTCDGTGRIPIYYTIQQWGELTGRKVPYDMPCYVLFNSDDGYWWALHPYRNLSQGLFLYVIATEAGKPPKDWRPE